MIDYTTKQRKSIAYNKGPLYVVNPSGNRFATQNSIPV